MKWARHLLPEAAELSPAFPSAAKYPGTVWVFPDAGCVKVTFSR
jgi:hypothetical protein